jgi:3-oxoacyl-[acyl-carrier-protein] synthase-3
MATLKAGFDCWTAGAIATYRDDLRYLGILGTGAALPDKTVGPADFIAMGTDPALVAEWDLGEHRVAVDESATDLEARAAVQAIERAGWEPGDLDLIIGSTAMPEKIKPTNASLTQHKIGARNAAVFELDMACISPVPALMVADSLYRAGQYRRILIVASCQFQSVMDHTDPAVYAVCGDGAGAIVLGETDGHAGVIATHLTANGEFWENVGIEPKPPKHVGDGLGCDVRNRFYIDHHRGGDPKKFFEWAMPSVPNSIHALLDKAGITLADVDWICPHQNVKTVSGAWLEAIGAPPEKVIETRKEYGNVGPANVLLNLNRGAEQRKFRDGDRILIFGQGAGMSVGATLVRWTGSANPRLTG